VLREGAMKFRETYPLNFMDDIMQNAEFQGELDADNIALEIENIFSSLYRVNTHISDKMRAVIVEAN